MVEQLDLVRDEGVKVFVERVVWKVVVEAKLKQVQLVWLGQQRLEMWTVESARLSRWGLVTIKKWEECRQKVGVRLMGIVEQEGSSNTSNVT